MHAGHHSHKGDYFDYKTFPFYIVIILYGDNDIADTDELPHTKWEKSNLDKVHLIC